VLEADGVKPHWRFKLDHDAMITWDDLIRGPQHLDPKLQSDPVIRRADGSWLYMLPSVIDDIDMGVTHIERGEDHVTNAGLQLQMFEALGATAPAFAHEALLVGSEGKLSKRLGSLGADAFREDGIEPLALNALLARIGTSDPVEAVESLDVLIETIDFSRFGRAPARFDMEELRALNARTIHQMPFATVRARLPDGMSEALWLAVRPNLATVSEAAAWLQIIEHDVDLPAADPADQDYLVAAAAAAGAIEWGDDPWHALTGVLKEQTGRKGRPLFLPLRVALTGQEHGPDMKALLPLIGRERTVARLKAAARS
jgi:glutamyl-tRNA synthetase